MFSAEAITAQAALRSGAAELTPQQQAQVERLKEIDRQVRQHEQAHLAAAGGYARSGASYSYTTGPDGKRYATGGEVSIDTGAASTPKATIQKMEVVKRAAVAPAEPSPQDRAVYTAAQKAQAEAQRELQETTRDTDETNAF